MLHCVCPANETIYTYETNGSCFFIVYRGLLYLLVDGNVSRQLKPQDGFGYMALLYNTKRLSTVRTIYTTYMWVLDRHSFRQAVYYIIIKYYSQNKKQLYGVRFFSSLTTEQKDLVVSSMIKQKYYRGQTIIQYGDPGSCFFFIKEGTASVFKGTKFIRKLTKGDSFGYQSLYYNTMRQLTIKADYDVVCLVLSRDALSRLLGDRIYYVTFKNFIKWAFEKNVIMNKLPKEVLERVVEEMKISSYKAQESIFRRGVPGFQKLVVVIEGSLKKLKNGSIVATKSQCFGEYFLLLENAKKILDDYIIMHTYGVIAEISDSAFDDIVRGQSYEYLIKAQQSRLTVCRTEWPNQVKACLSYADLTYIAVIGQIGKGQFGPVFALYYEGNEYVMKVLKKSYLYEYEIQYFALDYWTAFAYISFPFILAVGRQLQSANYLLYFSYMVRGMYFYYVLKQIGLLATEDAQFYTATIILILYYFSSKFLICRDIKPYNFFVDTFGHLKLLNLPTAKIVDADATKTCNKTYTIIGTPHYMAPDIVIGKGYTNLVDLWSLGVCLYEFLCGVLPFGDSSESVYQIYEDIMQTDLKFPEFLHDKKAKKLIEQLLSHNPNQRLGGSFTALKAHPWFENFDWESLIDKHRRLKPPYIPPHTQKLLFLKYKTLRYVLYELYTMDNITRYLKFDWTLFGQTIKL